MLITMLRVMDIEAYPALTMAGPRVEDIPADQFNHTVTVIRRPDGSFRVLDPTWSPVSRELWSSREARQGLVYGTPEGQGLTLSPHFKPEQNEVKAEARSEVAVNGTLVTRLQMVLTGYPCTYLRRTLDHRPPARRPAAIQAALRLGPSAELLGVRTTDPRDYSEDSRAAFVAKVPQYAVAGDQILMFRMPLLRFPLGSWLYPDLLWSLPEKGRRFPLRLRATRLLQFSEKIALPSGFEPVNLPGDHELDGPAGALSFKCHFADGVIEYSFRFSARKHLVPVAEYAGLVKAMKVMRELSDLEIICRRKGGRR